MGKLLGNYIHRSWENYVNFGTNRYKTTAEKVTTKIFEEHQKQIQNLAKSQARVDIKKIEKEYNQRNQDQYNYFKQILTKGAVDVKDQQILLQTLINRLSPATWSDSLKADIIANLEWDDSKQTLVYKGRLGSSSRKSSVKLSNLGSANEYRYINTILGRAEELSKSIGSSDLDQTTKNFYIDKINVQVIQPVKQIQGFSERSEEILRQAKGSNQKTQKYKGTLPVAAANNYFTILNDIKMNIAGIENINQTLQENFAELMGNLVGQGAINSGIQALIQEVQKSKGAGQKLSSKALTSTVSVSPSLDIHTLTDARITLTQSGSYVDQNGRLRSLWTFDGVGDGRFQKADANFTITIDGKNETFGVSIKNTDLTTHINDQIQNDWGNFINIQSDNSSVLLYLLGMNQSYPGIANHYLNIFAKHPDLSDPTTELHKAAYQSFGTAVLFSALSGKNQLRQGGQAQLLAIYDKKKNGIYQVRLFDIEELVNIAINKDVNLIARFSPAIDSISFTNANENDAASINENINIRLTKVLIEAKQKTIGAYISKAALNNILAKRDLT